MMVRIILNGCNGAMGKMLANIIAQDEQAQVVLVAERLEPTDNLVIVGVIVFVASDFPNLL